MRQKSAQTSSIHVLPYICKKFQTKVSLSILINPLPGDKLKQIAKDILKWI